MTKAKAFMPAGIRNKLMAAIAMLLVATILMVSSTYAWFTLSTAPEVTGITTSVGANGNLEIALLNTDTFNATGTIRSAVGDSSTATNDVTQSNITWGNLVDLSNSSYGLDTISLMPAAINLTAEGKLTTTSFLKNPVYGADGRVSELAANTVSAVNAGGSFKSGDDQTYGVRAVGTAAGLSAAQIALSTAKAASKSAITTASNAAKTAVNANATQFIGIALAGEATSYTQAQVDALKAMATGVETSLKKVVTAYSAAAAAAAIAGAAEENQETVAGLVQPLINNTNPENELLTTYGSTYGTIFNGLKTALANVAAAKNTLEKYVAGTTNENADVASGKSTPTQVNNAMNTLVGESDDWTYETDATESHGANTFDAMKENMSGKIYLGGAMQTIADLTGFFQLTKLLDVEVYAGKSDTAGAGTSLTTGLNGLTVSATVTESNITDFYGYVLDFAFRTNAADSFLQLQTAAANRVYSGEEGAELATQGSGSNVTFEYSDGFTDAQAAKMLNAIHIVFFNPDDGTIYANAKLNNLMPSGTSTTADIVLHGMRSVESYTLGKNNFTKTGADEYTLVSDQVMDASGNVIGAAAEASNKNILIDRKITKDLYNTLDPKGVISYTDAVLEDADNIVALNQNEVMKLSVLVYMDGNDIDNTATINAATSGSLKMNLQFSSSADLIPMENTALKQMTKE